MKNNQQPPRPNTATFAIAVALALALSSCGKPADKPAAAVSKAATVLNVSAEDVYTITNSAIASGPSITGSIQPERRADLRAEISSVVMQVVKENGDAVRRGDILVRLDDTAIRENLASAEASTRAATQAFEQAKRQLERSETLRKSGMVSAAALEDTETRRNSAQSELEGAKSRVAQARQQLTRTEVRAPFDGLVSDRKVSAGDTAQVGKELLKVIDPASMRIEGLISADNIGAVKSGQSVRVRVNGYGDQEFEGKVRRVNPSANAATRQVEVLVDFVGRNAPRLAGLYAEGRVLTQSTDALTAPASAIIRDGDKAHVWRVANGVVKRSAVQLGERDPRSGDFMIKAGVASDDKLIRYPTASLIDGQKVEWATVKTTSTNPTTTRTPATK